MKQKPRVYDGPEGGVAIVSVDYVIFENRDGRFLGFKPVAKPESTEKAA